VLASPFQMVPFGKLGTTPVAMTLGDVVPAIQQGAIDGAVGGIVVFTPLHFRDAAQYVTETGQPAVYVIAEISKSWYDSLPPDLQKIIDDDASAQQAAIAPVATDIVEKARKGWTDVGGELISLPPDEQAEMMKTFASAVGEVTGPKPKLNEAYKVVSEAAQRLQ
jgi:TRAP-type C4-dicarboxylate transport system substrate-binding protein